MPHLREHGFEWFDDVRVGGSLERRLAAPERDEHIAARSRDEASEGCDAAHAAHAARSSCEPRDGSVRGRT